MPETSEWLRVRRMPWRWIAGAGVLVALLLTAHRGLDRVARQAPVDWVQTGIEELTGVFSGILLVPFVAWLTLRYPLLSGRWRQHWWIYLAAAPLYSLASTTLMWGSRVVVFWLLRGEIYDYGVMPVRYLMEMPLQIGAFAMIVLLVTFSEHRRQARELERQLALAQMETLQLQMQPHFLFNALNAISAVVYEDPAAADRMIGRLADFLRKTLRRDGAHLVPLREELELVEVYLEVMRARMEDRLSCTVDCDPALSEMLVPQLLLQPLVENAIKYGADPATGKVEIVVNATAGNGSLQLEVLDRGSGASNGSGNGLGLALKNLQARLESISGSLTLEPQPAGGMRVRVTVPV